MTVENLTFTNDVINLATPAGQPARTTTLNGALSVDTDSGRFGGFLIDTNGTTYFPFRFQNIDGSYTLSLRPTEPTNTFSLHFAIPYDTAPMSVDMYSVLDNTYTAETEGVKVTSTIVCFVVGTAIRTMRGDIVVESLVVGDLVITASGASRPIRWLGHRKVDCAAHAAPSQMWPVRILAGAFGPGVPARDLYLSPGHPILVGADEDGEGGHLVPAMCLINGTTINRVEMDKVTYWHVELDQHDILLAEGLAAESYLDWGDRVFFTEGADHVLANPDFVVPGLARRCRPVAIDGPIVEAERQRLDMLFAMRLSRAAAWPNAEDTALLV